MDSVRIGATQDSEEPEEPAKMNPDEHLESQLAEISKTVKLLEKFQWFSNGTVVAVVLLGGYIWSTTSSRVTQIESNFRQEVKTELTVLTIQSDLIEIRKILSDMNTTSMSNQSRLDQAEKDLIKMSAGKR